MTIDEITRAKLFKSFDFFTRYFFKHTHRKKFSVNSHHEVMFNALERVMNGECNRLIINVAPRYSKTEIVVKNFIAYALALNPKSRFIHLSYSDSLALDNSESIKDLVTSDEYQRLFPYVQIKKDSKAKDKWYTTEGGGVLARSASGQVTGFGAGLTDFENEAKGFGGAIIIDDPIKPDDADSETLRDKVNYKFDSTIRNRVNSRNTPIIVIMQRLHEDDLCGFLMKNEPDEWEVISLPVITEDGQALWEDKHTLEELYKLRKINEYIFDTQYLQNPKPKQGLVFSSDELMRYKSTDIDKSQAEAIVSFVDTADGGGDALSAPIGYLIGNKIYIDDVLHSDKPVNETIPLLAEKLNKHQVNYCRIEQNFGGSMFTSLLRNEGINDGIMLLPVRAKGNKHTRIVTMAGFIKEYCVFRSDITDGGEYYKFMKNLTDYTKDGKVKHDDAPDALTGLCQLVRQMYSFLYSHIPEEAKV
jgi:predicted phage terminase large subunit-like protein